MADDSQLGGATLFLNFYIKNPPTSGGVLQKLNLTALRCRHALLILHFACVEHFGSQLLERDSSTNVFSYSVINAVYHMLAKSVK